MSDTAPSPGAARLAIFADITTERARQAALHREDGDHDLFVMCAVLGEECGEVQKAALEARWAMAHGQPKMIAARDAELREELVQCAAVAVNMIEMLDASRLTLDLGEASPTAEPEGNAS